MAHKLKIKPVPHIKRDGTVGTKKDFVVRCKRRGKVCCEEKFSTRREAEAYASEHWDYVSRRKEMLTDTLRLKRQFTTFKVSPDVQNYSWYAARKRSRRNEVKAA